MVMIDGLSRLYRQMLHMRQKRFLRNQRQQCFKIERKEKMNYHCRVSNRVLRMAQSEIQDIRKLVQLFKDDVTV